MKKVLFLLAFVASVLIVNAQNRPLTEQQWLDQQQQKRNVVVEPQMTAPQQGSLISNNITITGCCTEVQKPMSQRYAVVPVIKKIFITKKYYCGCDTAKSVIGKQKDTTPAGNGTPGLPGGTTNPTRGLPEWFWQSLMALLGVALLALLIVLIVKAITATPTNSPIVIPPITIHNNIPPAPKPEAPATPTVSHNYAQLNEQVVKNGGKLRVYPDGSYSIEHPTKVNVTSETSVKEEIKDDTGSISLKKEDVKQASS